MEKKYTYRKLESCGKTFFRILTNCHGGYWGMAPGTFDYDSEQDAQRKVRELEQAAGKPTRVNCGECLMSHVEIVPLNEDGTCPCCAKNHKRTRTRKGVRA